ncbi:LuxR C-terminal-related transcriptional regulator [Streptomyces blattellae]|uniref:LuxR C-terminal-related transcriptional regulator n=1 Tax=Streptomyces blattellae TaxID=2569855 RepID=UPI001E289A1E|nr:LuxR C-terminal-related transcriptional regulator [Streptomyces blattellae]
MVTADRFPLGSTTTLAELAGTPHPRLALLRAHEPASWLPALGGWLVTRRDLALRVLRDTDTFTVDDPRFLTAQVVGPSMLSLEGAEHARHRAPFTDPFRPREVRERFAGFVADEAARLVETVRPRGRAELRREVAGPLAVAVVAESLGLVDADADAATVLSWYDAVVSAVSDITAGRPANPAGAAAFDQLRSSVEATVTAGATCQERVAQYERWCGGRLRGLSLFARGALGTGALTAGDPEAARAHLAAAFAMAEEMGLVNPCLMPWIADLAKACLRTGARDRAVTVADWLRERAVATGLAWAAAAHARCRVMLARSAEEAADWLAVAERVHADQESAFELARTRLVAGEVLRRFRRPSAAREPLLLAQRTFTALDAVPWAVRAEAEVAATGHRTAVHGNEPPPVALLTPQELQVARAIGEGLSNVEAAASLFLSRKTIEAHLTRVYRELGVRSRSDLARCLAHAGVTG